MHIVFPVPVELCVVFSGPKTHGQVSGHKSDQQCSQHLPGEDEPGAPPEISLFRFADYNSPPKSLDLFDNFVGKFLEGFWRILGKFLGGFWTILGKFLGGFWAVLGSFLGDVGGYFRHFQESFREVFGGTKNTTT